MTRQLLTLLFVMSSPTAVLNAKEITPPTCQVYNGVNISHWLSQVGDATRNIRESYFTEMDVVFIKSVGFDHIRLPIDEKELWDEAGEPIEPAWDYLDQALTWCMRNDLNVVLDLHVIRSHHFNAENQGGGNTLWTDPAAQAQFLKLWTVIMDRVGHYPIDRLAYEFMNEAVAEDPEDWNRLLRKIYPHVRAREPERTVVMGSNRWQQIDTLKDLWVPEGDHNIILSFHNYEPFIITHYLASWTPLRAYTGPVQYPGVAVKEEDIPSDLPKRAEDSLRGANSHFDYSVLNERFQIAADFAKEKGLMIYCGEFGCLPTPGREIRMQYYRDVVAALDRLGIARANWDYQGGFRIVEYEGKKIDWELIHILTGHGPLEW